MIAKLIACFIVSAVLLPQAASAKNGSNANGSSQFGRQLGNGVPYRETIAWLTAQPREEAKATDQSLGPDLNTLQFGIGDNTALVSRYSSMSKPGVDLKQGRRR